MRYPLLLLALAAVITLLQTGCSSQGQEGRQFRAKEPPPLIDLIDPSTAPKDRPEIVRGFHLLLETKKHFPENVGNTMCCCHCHFAAGNSCGGVNGGISLVGVSKTYPKIVSGSTVTLQDRINGCFMRSMNGRPIDKNSPEMEAMVAYLRWISKAAENRPITWLGLTKLQTSHIPNPVQGQELFKEYCAKCHGDQGEGQPREYALGYPALWGENSFNDAAGMNRLPIFSSFIYHNMPYQDPCLTEEMALDIASFVTSQKRPHYEEKN